MRFFLRGKWHDLYCKDFSIMFWGLLSFNSFFFFPAQEPSLLTIFNSHLLSGCGSFLERLWGGWYVIMLMSLAYHKSNTSTLSGPQGTRMPYFNCHFALLSQFTELCPSLWKSDCDSQSPVFIISIDLNPKEKEAQ